MATMQHVIDSKMLTHGVGGAVYCIMPPYTDRHGCWVTGARATVDFKRRDLVCAILGVPVSLDPATGRLGDGHESCNRAYLYEVSPTEFVCVDLHVHVAQRAVGNALLDAEGPLDLYAFENNYEVPAYNNIKIIERTLKAADGQMYRVFWGEALMPIERGQLLCATYSKRFRRALFVDKVATI